MNHQTRAAIATAAAALKAATQTLGELYAVDGVRFYKYNRDFDGDQHYFSPREKLKNGNWRGITVVTTLRGRLPKKAKSDIVDKYDFKNFNLVSKEDLDQAIVDRFDEAGK